MKKLVVLLLIGCMASVANAGLYLTVNGQLAPEVIITSISDSFEIGVESTAGLYIGQFRLELKYHIGSMDYRDMVTATEYLSYWFDANHDDVMNEGDIFQYSDWSFPWQEKAGTMTDPLNITIDGGNVGNPPAATPYDVNILTQGIIFHQDECGDVFLNLYEKVNSASAETLADSVLFREIPEPMSMGLLSLGGLGLLRRRSKPTCN